MKKTIYLRKHGVSLCAKICVAVILLILTACGGGRPLTNQSSSTTPEILPLPPGPSPTGTPAPLVPTASLFLNGKSGSVSVLYNSNPTLSWTSTNTSSCIITSGSTIFPGTGTSGQGLSVGLVTVPSLIVLTCNGVQGGTATSNISVGITAGTAVLTASPLVVSYNETATLTWDSKGATLCALTDSMGAFTSNTAMSGTLTTSALTHSDLVKLTCAGTVVAQVGINVGPQIQFTVNGKSVNSSATTGSSVSFAWSSANSENGCSWLDSNNTKLAAPNSGTASQILSATTTYKLYCESSTGVGLTAPITVTALNTPGLITVTDTVPTAFQSVALGSATVADCIMLKNTGGSNAAGFLAAIDLPFSFAPAASAVCTNLNIPQCIVNTLAPGQVCGLAVVYSPNAIGTFTKPVTLAYYDGYTNLAPATALTLTAVTPSLATAASQTCTGIAPTAANSQVTLSYDFSNCSSRCGTYTPPPAPWGWVTSANLSTWGWTLVPQTYGYTNMQVGYSRAGSCAANTTYAYNPVSLVGIGLGIGGTSFSDLWLNTNMRTFHVGGGEQIKCANNSDGVNDPFIIVANNQIRTGWVLGSPVGSERYNLTSNTYPLLPGEVPLTFTFSENGSQVKWCDTYTYHY